MSEKIKAFIDSLLRTEKSKETAFNLIFYLTAASLLIGGIYDSINQESIVHFFRAVFTIIQWGCLYVACLFFIRKEKPKVTTILAAVFAAWTFIQFVAAWDDYRYYSFRVVFLDIVTWVAAIGGGALLIIYQLKKTKGEDTGRYYEYLLYAGVFYLCIHFIASVISFIRAVYYSIDYSYFTVGLFIKYFLLLILVQIPKWFIILGAWLAVDLVEEKECSIPQAEAVAEEPASEGAPEQEAVDQEKQEPEKE